MQAVFSNILTKSDHKIMNHLFGACDRLSKFTFAQQTIADDMSLSVSTIKRCINKLVSLGIVFRASRARDWNTNILRINSAIYEFAESIQNKYFYLKRIVLRNKVFKLKIYYQKLGLFDSDRNELPLYRKDIVNISCRVKDNVRARVTRYINCYKQERKVEMEAGEIVISPTLREITNVLHLSKHGQLKLLAFPDNILSVAWRQCKMKHGIKDPFSYLIVQCDQHSVSLQIKPNWDLYYAMLKRYKVDKDSSFIKKRSATIIQPVTITEHEPRWKKFVNQSVHPEFEKFFQQKIANDIL